MKTNNSLLPFGQATTHTPSVYMTGGSTTSPTRTRTNTSLMRAFAVFFSLLLGYGSLNAQIISTIVGNGTASSTGDGGLASAATVNGPFFITTDASGNIYIAEGNRIRRITASTGIITTICGNGTPSSTGDGGLATAATVDRPRSIAFDASGNIYIADTGELIRKITIATGIITTICGTGTSSFSGDGGLATAATIRMPRSVFFDNIGDLYFTDSGNNRVRKITTATGIITTICGNGTGTSTGDGGLATAATVYEPRSIAFDASNNIYISEGFAVRIRKITASTGIISTICGNGISGSTGDGGLATAATIGQPFGLYVDKITGNIYIAEGNRIRKITASTGIITTICGTGAASSTGDGGAATAATINFPAGIHYANGKVYIGELSGTRIRQINSCPTITISPASLAGGTVGTSYSQTVTQTGLVGTPAWSISAGTLPAGLTLAGGTGVISGTPTTAGTPTFTVSVGDGSGCIQTQVYSIAVVCPTVTVTPTPTTQSYVVGTAISNITLGASGVTSATYTYAVTSGALPAGVTLSAGVISGTPTTATTATSFTITATASIGGCTGTAVYNYSVVCPTLVFGVTTATGATVGTAYSLNAGVTGNTQSVVYTVSSLPAGLSIASGTGAISGIPTAPAASATYTITATQGTCTVTRGYTFAVVCPTVTVTPTPTTQSYVVGTAISSITLGASGVSSATYTYAVTSGALPAGVTLVSDLISGTPTTTLSSGTFTVTATSSIGGCTGTAVYTFAVACPTITVTPTPTTQSYVVGTAISSITLGASGVSSATYTYAVTSGALPVGVTLVSDLISGTPTTALSSGTFTVTATSSIGGCTGTAVYTFAVACPTITVTPTPTVQSYVVGTAISSITLGASGVSSATYTYAVTSGALPVGVTLSAGVISGTPTTTLSSGTFTVTATSSIGGCTGTTVYNYSVVCPTIVFTNTTATGATVGTAYSLNAGVTGNTQSVVYSVSPTLPAGLTFSTSTGAISGTPAAPAVSATYTVTATQGTCTATQAYTFAVACVGISINPATLANGVVGTAYTQTATQTGLTGTPVWSVTGTLPNGLSIASATGIISGTPTTAGTFPFVVNVTDGACSQTRSYSVVIACPPIVFTNTTATGATVGTAYSLNAGVTGNTQSVVYTVSSLPAGLSIASGTGAISGTPTTVTASATYTVTATQGTCSVTQGYAFAVVCPTLVFGVTTATGATVGTAYSLNTGVTGNTQSVVYSVSPTLPAGLSIDTNTGTISGTPTAPVASATYTVTATQGTCTATQAYTFAVTCVGIAINPVTLANGVVGTAYSQTATQTGLTGTPTWSVTGTLPNGLSIASATGVISGTPTTNGTFPFVVSVTDGACSQTRNYSVVIACPAIVFGVTTTTNAVVGIAYTLNAGATGNTSTLTYSVSPALPAGLSLNTATGAISGAATALTASATYVVTATQTVACFATQSYTFAVIPACSTVVLGLASIPNATVGTPYSQTFTATGGTAGATYTFSTTAPQLAGAGFTLSTAGVLSGTPTFSTSITLRVTATTTPNSCTGFRDYTITINPNPATSVDNALANSVKVSPNPSNGDFNVDFGTINMAKSSVSVYDAQGKTVFTSENNSNLMNISLDKFANGIYLLEVKTSTGRITKRLAKTN